MHARIFVSHRIKGGADGDDNDNDDDAAAHGEEDGDKVDERKASDGTDSTPPPSATRPVRRWS